MAARSTSAFSLAISGPLSDFLLGWGSPPPPASDRRPRRRLMRGGRPSILVARADRKDCAPTNSP